MTRGEVFCKALLQGLLAASIMYMYMYEFPSSLPQNSGSYWKSGVKHELDPQDLGEKGFVRNETFM